jgi:hypothetical protein
MPLNEIFSHILQILIHPYEASIFAICSMFIIISCLCSLIFCSFNKVPVSERFTAVNMLSRFIKPEWVGYESSTMSATSHFIYGLSKMGSHKAIEELSSQRFFLQTSHSDKEHHCIHLQSNENLVTE